MLLLFMLVNTIGVAAFAGDIDNCAEITDIISDCADDAVSEESDSSEQDDGCEVLPADEYDSFSSNSVNSECADEGDSASAESVSSERTDKGESVSAENVSSEYTDEGKESSEAGSETSTAHVAYSVTAQKELTSAEDNTTSESSESLDLVGEDKSLSENGSETDIELNVGSGSAGGSESDSEAGSVSSDRKATAAGAGHTENPDNDMDNDKEDSDDVKDDSRENAASKDAGLVLKGEGKFDILITGTLKSDGTPILIDKEVNPKDVSITVWKIEKSSGFENDKEGHIVKEGIRGEDSTVTDKSNKVEAEIKYIIRIEPSQENIIRLSGVGESHDLPVANEGESVTLKIAVPDGYKLIGAYNGIGKKALLRKDEHGDYYVTVPRGGGVYLSVELEKDSDDDDADEDDSDRKFEKVCKYLNENCDQKQSEDCECNSIIYDLNGGTLEGDRGPVIIEAESGKEYTLLKAPVKKGARFVRWTTSCKDIHVSKPGESFRFTHCVKFVAVWDESEIKSSRRCHGEDSENDDDSVNDDDCDDTDDDDTEDEGPDVTETVQVTTEGEKELNLNSVKVDGNPAVGVRISASCDVDVDDEISVIGGDQGATGIIASAEGKTVETEIETGDGMTVKSEGSSVGIEAYASEDGEVSLEFEGDITVSSGS